LINEVCGIIKIDRFFNVLQKSEIFRIKGNTGYP